MGTGQWDGPAVTAAMKENGISNAELGRRLWPKAEAKDRANRLYQLKVKMNNSIGVKPDTAQKLADALGVEVSRIGDVFYKSGRE